MLFLHNTKQIISNVTLTKFNFGMIFKRLFKFQEICVISKTSFENCKLAVNIERRMHIFALHAYWSFPKMNCNSLNSVNSGNLI